MVFEEETINLLGNWVPETSGVRKVPFFGGRAVALGCDSEGNLDPLRLGLMFPTTLNSQVSVFSLLHLFVPRMLAKLAVSANSAQLI
jgi:hypothetical protein